MFENGFLLIKRGDNMAYLAFADIVLASMLVYAVWVSVDEARGCFDEYNLYYKGKLRNGVVTLDFYIRLFIVGLIPIINVGMIYHFLSDREERLNEWLELIEEKFDLESR
jgi:hypothetical protein